MLGTLAMLSLLPYAGYDYSGAAKALRVRAETQNVLGGVDGQKDARVRLAQGTYMRRRQRCTRVRLCQEFYDIVQCSIRVRRQVVQEAKRSTLMCQGCPYCGGAPCFVWPCDSGLTSKPHGHQGRGVWFPEEDQCPFVVPRAVPVIVEPERTQEVIDDTCAPYACHPEYTCVSQKTIMGDVTKVYRRERQNTCRVLENQGCVLNKRTCMRYDKEWCVAWEASYSCQEQEDVVTPMPSFFCQEGHGVQDPPSQDMGRVVAVLRGVQEGAFHAEEAQGQVRVFGGHAFRCHTDVMQFRDCCKVMDGWGKHLGFGCSQEERTLARLRQEKRCVFVGERVSERLVGVSARRQKVFCCFPSALVRILREHAQKKLCASWGRAVDPDCRGVLVSSLHGVDFSDVDAEEVRASLCVGQKKVDYAVLQKKVERAVARMESGVR